MSEKRLGRRRILSSGLALMSGAMSWFGAAARPRPGGEETLNDSVNAFTDVELVEEEDCHAPFRAEFMAWLHEASERFVLPVTAHAASASHTELHIREINPAIWIALKGDHDISVGADWDGENWDLLASMDVLAKVAPDGTGWRSHLLIPEARRIRPTRETVWREDGFEWLLKWVNDELARATHLAFWQSDSGGATWAQLVRDGTNLRTGRPVISEGSPPEHLVPVHMASTAARA